MTDPLLILIGEVERVQRLPLFIDGEAIRIVTDPLLILIGEVERVQRLPLFIDGVAERIVTIHYWY